MGLLKKLGLKKKSKKEKKDVDIPHPTSPLAVNEAEVPAAPETEAPDRPDSPEPENDFARALRQKSTRLRHIEPPKPPPPIVPETPPAAQDQIAVDDDDDDDEGEIVIGETESEEEEEENSDFLRAIRNKSLKKQSSAEKEIIKPQAVLADKEEIRKSSADERVAQMFAKQREEDLSKAKNKETERIEEIKLNNQADQRVAQMFNNQNQSDTNRIEKNFGYKPPQKNGTSDERVAQMFAKHKSGVEEKGEPTKAVGGKTNEQKKAVEAMLQKSHDPKAFIDSTKGSTKVEIPHETTSSANSAGTIEKTVGLTFAERRKMAEAMSQRKLVVTEQKHTVDIKKENFGNRTSFAERRKMLEAKSQQQNAPSPVRAPKINIPSPANEAPSIPEQDNLPETNTVEEEKGDASNAKSVGQSADDEEFVDLCELQDDSQEVDESEDSENQGNTDGSESSQKEGTTRQPSRLLMAVAQAAAAKKEAAS